MNRNVFLNILLAGTSGVADSVWSGTVFVAFLYTLTNDSNSKVGYVEAMQGASQLASALPVGYLADKYSRSGVIKVGAVLMACAIALTTYSVVQSESLESGEGYDLLCGALVLWGVCGGIVNGPAQALFADSLPTGTRSRYYNYLFSAYLVGASVGPLLAIVLFSFWDDEWSQPELRTVILVGMGLEVPCVAIMMFFRDDKALGKESEHTTADKQEELDARVDDDDSMDPAEVKRKMDKAAHKSRCAQCVAACGISVSSIPYVLFASDVVVALASGMTIKFFPLFFKNDCELSPRGVQTIYFLNPLIIALFSNICQPLAKRFGRIGTILLVQTIGVASLFCMILTYKYGFSNYITIALYLLRTGVMNSTYPMRESILMDYVPKETRARWKSLDSITSFGWCGSAALGGYLGDTYGYSFTFIITAIMQGISTAMMIPLWPIVAKESDAKKVSPDDGDGKTAGEGGCSKDELAQPLLVGDE